MSKNSQLIDDLFRREYGKMVATLSRLFGFEHLEMVEDVVQDAFAKAVGTWREQIPDNPSAWLMQVAKNKAIDILRRNANFARKVADGHLQGPMVTQIDQLFLEHEIADSQLRLLFMCCHPSLKLQDQIALNLKVVSGFGRKEIARALLTSEENIKKRLHRARKHIKEQQIELVFPQKDQVHERLSGVLMAIYLIFNEGYHSSISDQIIRKDLCLEAMRLCKLLHDHPAFDDSSIQGLLALMCLHAARFESRIGPNQELVLMKHQDRSKWDRDLIQVGTHFYHQAWREGKYSMFHIEAAIALEHYVAKDYESTNWKRILEMYKWLETIRPSPIIQLNQVIVLLEMGQITKAQEMVEQLKPEEFRSKKHLLHSVKAQIFSLLEEHSNFTNQIQLAIQHAPTETEKQMLKDQLTNSKMVEV